MNNNNAPFYVGQRVVAVRDSNCGNIKKGQRFVISEIIPAHCSCRRWLVDVGIVGTNTYNTCYTCHSTMKWKDNTHWKNPAIFAPIDERTVSIPESLKEQAEEMIRGKEIREETIKQPEKELA